MLVRAGVRAHLQDGQWRWLCQHRQAKPDAQSGSSAAECNAMIIRSHKANAEMFNATENLKLIVRAGAGVGNIDLTCVPKVEKGNASSRLQCQNQQVDKCRVMFTNRAQEQLMELMGEHLLG